MKEKIKVLFSDEVLKKVCIVLGIFVVLTSCFSFTFTFATAEGTSNYPTIKEGEILFEAKRFYSVEIDDFVCIIREDDDDNKRILKRVVAEEGDDVVIKDGHLYINDVMDEWDPEYYYLGELDITVPADSYFVLGDNRMSSIDSRSFGCISKDEIVGKLIMHR